MLNSIELVDGNIKSTDLVNIINTFRYDEGKTSLDHSDFMKKIRKEVSELDKLGINQGNFSPVTYRDKKGEDRPCYSLTRDGMLEMLNSESVYCRAKTIEYINSLENKVAAVGSVTKELKALLMIGEKTDELDTRVVKLENNMTIDYGQQLDLNNLAKIVVMKYVGGKDVPAYNKYTKKVFSKLWKDYKRVFNVNSYKNTAVRDFIEAKNYISSWNLPDELEDAIIGCNMQR